jgi:uncharacterized protein (TIGR02145 family)
LTARYDDQYLIPDSIVVRNLTHPGDTVLYFPDTILVLNNLLGQVYRTVQIGQQCWMKDNLNAGVRIDYPDNPGSSWTIEKYCFDNLEENCTLFGGLYNWFEVVNNQNLPLTPPTRGICPEGWHLPADAEWTELANFAGGPSIAARALKTVGCALWPDPNDATNKSGFSALPGGSCFHYGFGSKGYQVAFWSADFKGLGGEGGECNVENINCNV